MADKMLENNEKARQNAKEIFDLVRKITAEIHAEHHRPAVRFSLEPGEPGIFESKAGGTPYLPRDMAWPLDGRGCAMGLLAQVDCAGLAGLPDFPTAGLLQFFIGLDDVWGIDFDDQVSQKGFRVLYHETVDHTVTADEVEAKRPPLPEDKNLGLPLDGPCRIVLKAPSEQRMNGNDPRFGPMLIERWNRARPDLQIKRVWDLYSQVPVRLRDYSATEQPGWDAPFHQIGGYPYFTQNDPREEHPEYKDFDALLFQLDSDGGKGKTDLVLWGDCGVANFFISRDALRRRDFSRVAYTWDCC